MTSADTSKTSDANPLPPADEAAQLRELLAHVLATHEAEKRSLAQELHGDLGASLTALNMHLVLLAQKLPPDQDIGQRLGKMKALVLAISSSNRRIQLALRPDKLDVFGLKVALQEMAEEFQRLHSVRCRISLPDEELHYPPELEMAVFRMVEEALKNAARHAGASEVQIILDDEEDALQVTVRDNGCGIDPARIEGLKSHGLRMLRERAAYLHGTVRIGPARTDGTIVSFSLPKKSAE